VWPCVKDHIAICACEKYKNHVSLEWNRKSVTTIVLGDHDYLLRVSNFDDLASFRAILAIFCQHMRRSGYLWVSGETVDTGFRFLDPDFHTGNGISATWRCFLLIFCIRYAECPPYFYFRSTWPIDLETVQSSRSPLTVKISTKLEVDTTIRCLIIALLLLIHYMTLWPWSVAFRPWSVVIHDGWHGQHLH